MTNGNQKIEEIEVLKSRIKEGNRKLNLAWEAIIKLDHQSARWQEEVEKWHEANERLSALCSELKYLGFTDCLYIENGKKTRNCLTEGLGCRVCPSQISYWETELMNLPSGKG